MEKQWTTLEAAQCLGISEPEVEELIRQGRLTGYKLGGQFLRFRPEQVEALKGSMQTGQPHDVAPARPPTQGTWKHQTRDFVYFYDLYVVSATLLAVLVVYLITAI